MAGPVQTPALNPPHPFMDARIRRTAFLFLALAISLFRGPVPAWAESIGASLTSTEKRQLQREARLVVDLLQNLHYSGRSFREIENKEMVTRFLEELDPGNYFLTADDVEFMHRRFDHSLKSVYLLRGDLQPAFEIFDLYATRARERLNWIDRWLLTGVFDFSLDEDFVQSRKSDPPAEVPPADRRWELWLKEQVLQEMLAGRDTPAATVVVGKHYSEFRRQLAAVDALTVRERFFDALIRSFDPHSGYFSADSAREFAVGMENAVAGVGLDLRKENGRCVVASVQPGGPADLQSDIQAGDIIDELGDGDGPGVDASRKPLRELVALVRGQSGTKLRLTYHPAGTTRPRSVTLERTRVLLGAERAHGAVSLVPGKNGADRRIGWIVLPTFYAAGEKSSATSATRDVRDLLGQMAANKGIDGLVLDLRNNPGGALTEAVALSGLFLPQGSVMLVRGLDGSVAELAIDKENKPVFSGPLVVLTSAQSASASEIFAGAMQAHRRAVIVGATATFGKGTVQNYIELAKAQQGVTAPEAANWGTLRLTYQRFYLPDGRSMQRAGVPSDIVLPAAATGPTPTERETDLPHALAAESITPPGKPFAPAAGHTAVSEPLLHRLHDRAETDFQALPEWALWREEQAAWQAAMRQKKFSLRLDARRSEWDKNRAEQLARLRVRRQLAAQAAFATDPLEIALLQPELAAHQAKLRAATGEDGKTLLHHLQHGMFTVETDRGHLRRLRLEAIDFREFSGNAAELAAAFSAGAGVAATPEEIRLVLQDLALLEHKTDDAVLDCFAKRIAGGKLEKTAVTLGAEALFDRVAMIDEEMLRERPGLDVPLRECLRLAADWTVGSVDGN